jgi:hypothetical protein
MRTALLTILLVAAASLPVWASADPEAIAVLGREHLWLKAIATRDAALLGTILAENFVHINYRGEISYREQELVNVVKAKPNAQVTTEQTVDFAGDRTAVVHGLNTVSQQGKVILRLRYTDVYVKLRGHWMALSAQETRIAP